MRNRDIPILSECSVLVALMEFRPHTYQPLDVFHCRLLELLLVLVLLAACYYQTFSTIASTTASIASSTATLTANIDTTITTQLEPLEFRRQSIHQMPSIVRG